MRQTAAIETARQRWRFRGLLRPARRATAGARALFAHSPEALVDLQRAAGNRAVTSLVQPVQRVGGWVDADRRKGSGLATGESPTGWNAEEHAVGKIRRISR